MLFSKLGETLGLLASAACAIIFYALWVNNPWLTRYRFWTAAIAAILLYMLFQHFWG